MLTQEPNQEIELREDALAACPARFALYYKIFPLELKENHIILASSTPEDIVQMDALAVVLNRQVKLVLKPEKEIFEAIRKFYGLGAETIEHMMQTVETQRGRDVEHENIEEIDSEASIGKFVNQLLAEAYRGRATDIHIEPDEDRLHIRYRIDGVLYDAHAPENIRHFKDSINSRIKILSRLNIAQKRLPQDGRFKVTAKDVELDLRVSFIPTVHGESVVIRLLNQNHLYDLPELGLDDHEMILLDRLIQVPHGIIFVTGPTGSGKTTTLYSCLAKVNNSQRKILTIEDPVEYQLKGISQIQVNPAIGLSFAHGLRSMLRHDPDIMMVGEVRDQETAQIAVQVALTGHLVFSTLHTNDAASGVTRLLDMGLEPYLVSSSVICFIAQRLVRILCPHCKVPYKPLPGLREEFELQEEQLQGVFIYEPVGCELCQGTGYFGRKGIYEILVLDEDLRGLIQSRATAGEISKLALTKGMRTLRQSGWKKIVQGLTTPEEVLRVSGNNLEKK